MIVSEVVADTKDWIMIADSEVSSAWHFETSLLPLPCHCYLSPLGQFLSVRTIAFGPYCTSTDATVGT